MFICREIEGERTLGGKVGIGNDDVMAIIVVDSLMSLVRAL